jgi:hypothetical protein
MGDVGGGLEVMSLEFRDWKLLRSDVWPRLRRLASLWVRSSISRGGRMVDGAMRGLPIWRVEVDDMEVVILCLREDGTNGLSCTNIFGKYTHSSKLHHVCRFDRRQSNSRC